MSIFEQSINNIPEVTYSKLSTDKEGIVRHVDNITSATYKMSGSTGPYGKENQDAHSINVIDYNGKKVTIICGCDGHGTFGKMFSSTVVNELPHIIICHLDNILVDSSTLYGIFEIFNETLKSRFISLTNGGTTVTILIKFDGCQICANLADFDAITKIDTDISNITFTKDGVSQDVTSNILQLTDDHSPNSISESLRLLDLGCDIRYSSCNGSTEIDAYTRIDIDGVKTIKRVPWTKQSGAYSINVSGDIAMYIYQGLLKFNLSRSIGDYAAEYMIPRPTITVVKYPSGTETKTILGSDGYFNCFTLKELHQQLLFVPEAICSNGYDMVGKTFGYENADNMTVIVV